MRRMMDLTDRKFNMLTAIRPVSRTAAGNVVWECICDCGNKSTAQGSMLKNGSIRSCGCQIVPGVKKANTTHGMRYKRLYRTWINMKSRCLNNKHKSYSDYGGRGISVCEEWIISFQAFMEWALSNGYKDTLTIERIDTNGNYVSSNCRWATTKEQGSNKRNIRFLVIKGESRSISEWAELSGISKSTIRSRLQIGLKGESLLLSPKR